MSTEAMREAFEQRFYVLNVSYPLTRDPTGVYDYKHKETQGAWVGWQAANANQEALIKAVLEVAADVCEGMHYLGGNDFAEAIRQITPQQVMEKMNLRKLSFKLNEFDEAEVNKP